MTPATHPAYDSPRVVAADDNDHVAIAVPVGDCLCGQRLHSVGGEVQVGRNCCSFELETGAHEDRGDVGGP